MLNSSLNSRTGFNFVTSIASYAVSLSVAISYIPYLISELGLGAYGMIALSFSLVQFAAPITQAISASMNQRLVANWSDHEKFSSTFSTTLILSFILAVIFGITAIFVSTVLEYLINVPHDLIDETRWLFLATASAFILSLAVMPFGAVIFSRNAIYLLNLRQVVESLTRVGAVILLFMLFGGSLEFVASSIILASAVGASILVVGAVSVRRNLVFRIRGFSKHAALAMAKTGYGVIMVQLGTLMLLGSNIVIVNLTFGPETGGAYAALAQWSVVLNGLILSVGATVTAKVMLDYHALNGQERSLSVAKAIRLLTCFAALPAGFVAGIAPDLLLVWVGPEVAQFSLTLTVLALPLAVNVVSVPVLAGQLAADRMTQVGVVYLILGVFYIAAAVTAARLLSWGGLEVAMVMGLFLLIKNYAFVIPMVALTYGRGSLRMLYVASLYPWIWTAAVALITWLIASVVNPESFLGLIVIGLAVTAIYGALAMASLPSSDRTMLLNMIRRILPRRSVRHAD